MPVPADEYPVHQVPQSIAIPGSTDRNFYDRCYFNAHDRTGDIFLVTGFGVYPNLGVMDAYATVRRGDRQVTVRASDAFDERARLDQRVGPYSIEVVDPLNVVHVVCDGAEHGVGFDLTWTGSFPAVEEPHHIYRQGNKTLLEACRFAQVGTWSGTLEVEGERFTVGDDVWVGTRDRSWGIRGVGEAEPPGRWAAETPDDFGFWWLYVPLRFDDFAIVLICQEDGNGTRTLNDAVRVWPAATGRPPEQLGWPQVDIRYRPGTRDPEGATIHLTDSNRQPLDLEVEALGFVALNCGPGYGGDPDWSHGQWLGRDFLAGSVADLSDPAVAGRIPFTINDHVTAATFDGQEGWGLFEHGTIGRHAPSGFADFGSVAG